MPHHANTRLDRETAFARSAGVVESVLARVMDAFQVRMQGALLAASVKTLSESPAVARLMAAEPAAPQVGSSLTFKSTLNPTPDPELDASPKTLTFTSISLARRRLAAPSPSSRGATPTAWTPS